MKQFCHYLGSTSIIMKWLTTSKHWPAKWLVGLVIHNYTKIMKRVMVFFRSMTWEKCQKQTALAVENGWNYFPNLFLGWESHNLMKDINPTSNQLVSKVNLAGMTCGFFSLRQWINSFQRCQFLRVDGHIHLNFREPKAYCWWTKCWTGWDA